MRALLLALLLWPPLAWGGHAGLDADTVRRLRAQGLILPLDAVLAAARRHRPGRVLDVALEREGGRYVYAVQILDARGVVWEVELDATDASLVETEKGDEEEGR